MKAERDEEAAEKKKKLKTCKGGFMRFKEKKPSS